MLLDKKIDKLAKRIEKYRLGGAWYRRTANGIVYIVKEVFTSEGKPIKSSCQLLSEMNCKQKVKRLF